MKIEEALPYLRMGCVLKCKLRHYVICDDVLCSVWIPKNSKVAKLYGVANLNGQDFMTDKWELTDYAFDRWEYEQS